MRAYIADDDVLGRERLADRGHHLLRREWRGRVFGRGPERPVHDPDLLVLPLFDALRELRERLVELAHHLDRGLVMAIELGGRAVDMDDDLVALGIPQRRGPLDEVVTDGDDQIGLGELRDVRELRTRTLQSGRR